MRAHAAVTIQRPEMDDDKPEQASVVSDYWDEADHREKAGRKGETSTQATSREGPGPNTILYPYD